jgi:hypothetical protein
MNRPTITAIILGALLAGCGRSEPEVDDTPHLQAMLAGYANDKNATVETLPAGITRASSSDDLLGDSTLVVKQRGPAIVEVDCSWSGVLPLPPVKVRETISEMVGTDAWKKWQSDTDSQLESRTKFGKWECVVWRERPGQLRRIKLTRMP